ncbi:hypothetical protein [Altererythrobacter sp. GH1-8]|uniref:hypothetical protein n=1 Tax=Altererythrobacter sp. GH1-8 TaxID=3349333 RepID=UPI00374DD833
MAKDKDDIAQFVGCTLGFGLIAAGVIFVIGMTVLLENNALYLPASTLFGLVTIVLAVSLHRKARAGSIGQYAAYFAGVFASLLFFTSLPAWLFAG